MGTESERKDACLWMRSLAEGLTDSDKAQVKG